MNKSKFKVEVKEEHHSVYLSVTHNGYQWTSIEIKNPRHEIPLIFEALWNYRKEMP